MEFVTYHNPILKGFRPDPSICFVHNDCYLVNSTFEYYPGVPIFHSTDLIHWDQIGACLTRDSQIQLENCRPSGGIYAPTIRYHAGKFFMITTNVTHKGNFIVHTDDIHSDWSEPQWIDHRGIDPSLFFDEDGACFYCGTGEGENGKQGIVLFEIDPENGRILSDKRMISYGLTANWPEGPHIYKVNGWYYLMLAEGGTEYSHMETIFRSRDIHGSYEPCPHNPILSNRFEMYNQIQCCGHADIAQDSNGNWWMVCLGIRKLPNGTLLHNLGRETFLAPVTWTEDGWPIVGTNGTIQEVMSAPLPQGKAESPSPDFRDDFTNTVLDVEWTSIRKYDGDRIKSGGGKLRIQGGPETLNDYTPSFIGVRQKEFVMTANVTVSAEFPCSEAKAGMTVFYSKDNHYDFYLQKECGKLYAVLSKKIMDVETIAGRVCLQDCGDEATLQIQTGVTEYVFRVVSGKDTITVGTGYTAGLCTEATMTMTFTGTFIGLFACNTAAEFRSFRIKKL
jgi:Beta-xylosidase